MGSLGFTLVHFGSLGFALVHLGSFGWIWETGKKRVILEAPERHRHTHTGFLLCTEILSDLINFNFNRITSAAHFSCSACHCHINPPTHKLQQTNTHKYPSYTTDKEILWAKTHYISDKKNHKICRLVSFLIFWTTTILKTDCQVFLKSAPVAGI